MKVEGTLAEIEELFQEREIRRQIAQQLKRARQPGVLDLPFDLLERLIRGSLGLLEKTVNRLVAAVLR